MKILRYLSPKNPSVRAVLFPILLTAAVLTFVCKVFGLYPFGDGSLCWCDMRQQGLPLLMMLRNALLSKESLVYMPELTGGADFVGVAAFFLWNPGSLLSVFWKAENLLDLLNLLVFGKLLLCAGTAGWFFYRRFPQNGVGFATAFSVIYALCGYGLLYYQNLMWLDVMALFPLFLLACYALLERGRPLPYVLLMTACMATCFYIGFMVAIFALLFFGVHLWLLHKNRRRTAVQFLLGSLTAALLSAVVWLPSLWQVVHSARSTYLSDSLTSCSWLPPLNTSLPLLLCSAAIPALFFVTLVFGPKWDRKSKALAILCVLLLIPMFLEPVNRMWHMGSYMCFPCRFGFMPILLMLALIAHLWAHSPAPARKRGRMAKWALGINAILVIAVGIALKIIFSKRSEIATSYICSLWGDIDSLSVHLLVFSIVALAAVLWTIAFRKGWLKKSVASVFLCALILCESTFYTSLYIGKIPNLWQFNSFDDIVDLSDQIDTTESFARVKTSGDLLDSNMVGALGYPSFGGYTSLVNEDTLYTAKKLGYTANWMDVGLNGGTRFSDALLSMGYSVNLPNATRSGNTVVYRNDSFRIEKLQSTLPLGLLVDSSALAATSSLPDGDRIALQDHLAKTLFGENSLLTRYNYAYATDCTVLKVAEGKTEIETTGVAPSIVYSVYPDRDISLYLDCFDGCSTLVREPIFQSFSVAVNGMTVNSSYPNGSESGFLYLGDYAKGDAVNVTLTPLKDVCCASFGLFGIRHDAMEQIISSTSTANITYDGHAYVGSFVAGENKKLLLTLPYDKGYKAVVNGRRQPVQKAMGNFCSISLAPGETAVKITYSPPGLAWGWILTVLGGAMLVLAFVFRRRIDTLVSPHQALQKIGSKTAVITLLAVSLLCFAAIYLFPVLFKLFNL